jgi:hypothetical protein
MSDNEKLLRLRLALLADETTPLRLTCPKCCTGRVPRRFYWSQGSEFEMRPPNTEHIRWVGQSLLVVSCRRCGCVRQWRVEGAA